MSMERKEEILTEYGSICARLGDYLVKFVLLNPAILKEIGRLQELNKEFEDLEKETE